MGWAERGRGGADAKVKAKKLSQEEEKSEIFSVNRMCKQTQEKAGGGRCSSCARRTQR